MERSYRTFQGKATIVDQVSLKLVDSIRDFLSSRRGVKPSFLNKSFGASSSIPDCIFS